MRLSLGAVTLRAADTGLRCKNSLKNIPTCAQFLFPGQDGLQHDGLSSDRDTRDRALGRGGRTPVAAKTLGGISLLVWIAVVVCGRWIGFTLH
jgi:hypothetical protein